MGAGAVRFSSSPAGSSPAGSSGPSGASVLLPSMTVDTLPLPSMDVNMSLTMRAITLIDETCCPRVLAAPLGEDEAERLAGALRVLADPARLRLLSLIGSHPDGEACVCDLTVPLGLSQPTVSHHLKVLTDAGVLGREQRGRWVYYSLLPEPMELLRTALARPRPQTEASVR